MIVRVKKKPDICCAKRKEPSNTTATNTLIQNKGNLNMPNINKMIEPIIKIISEEITPKCSWISISCSLIFKMPFMV
tara:strand:+ start:127 stop:357 length:231 start_codon:yes stop_codon:yes gene_type:complete